jgi:hypothetical protein
VYIFRVSNPCYMSRSSHPPWLDHSSNKLVKRTSYEPPHYAVFFAARSCWPLAQTPSWRNTPYRLSESAYSTCSQRPSICGGRLLQSHPQDASCCGYRDPHNKTRNDIRAAVRYHIVHTVRQSSYCTLHVIRLLWVSLGTPTRHVRAYRYNCTYQGPGPNHRMKFLAQVALTQRPYF